MQYKCRFQYIVQTIQFINLLKSFQVILTLSLTTYKITTSDPPPNPTHAHKHTHRHTYTHEHFLFTHLSLM